MKLLTKELTKKLPELYSTSEKNPQDVKVVVKFFCPYGRRTWFATEYDSESKTFFGFVKGNTKDDDELGYFSLTELENAKLAFGLKIERDLYFDSNTSLADVMK